MCLFYVHYFQLPALVAKQNKYIPDLPPWPMGTPLPANFLAFGYDPATDGEYSIVPEQAGGAGGQPVIALPIATFQARRQAGTLDAYAGWLLLLTGRADGLQIRVYCTGAREVNGDDAYTYSPDLGTYAPVTYDPGADTWTPRLAYDDTAVRAELADHENRLDTLEAQPTGPANTDALPEGGTNLYYTDARTLAVAVPLAGTAASAPVTGSINFTTTGELNFYDRPNDQNTSVKGEDGFQVIIRDLSGAIAGSSTLTPGGFAVNSIILNSNVVSSQAEGRPDSGVLSYDAAAGQLKVNGQTIGDAATVLATKLAGYAKAATARALTTADSILVAFGVLEKQVDNNTAALGTAPALVSITAAGVRNTSATTLAQAISLTGDGGTVIVNRATAGSAANLLLGRNLTLDLQGHPLDLLGADLHLYAGARVINIGLIHNGRIFIRDGNGAGVQTLRGGTVAAQIFSQANTNPVFRLYGTQIVNFGGAQPTPATLSPTQNASVGNLNIELYDGAAFVLYPPAPETTVTTIAASTLRDVQDVPQAVRDAVVAGTYSSGELQGAQPAGSLAGFTFTTATYGYAYQRGAAGALVWNRFVKS